MGRRFSINWKPSSVLPDTEHLIQRFSFEPPYTPDLGPVQHVPSTLSKPVETTDIERRAVTEWLEDVDFMCPISEPSGIQTFEYDIHGIVWRMTLAGDLSNKQPPPILDDLEDLDKTDSDTTMPDTWMESDMRLCPGITVAIVCRGYDLLQEKNPTFFYYDRQTWEPLSESTGLVDLLWLEFQAGQFLVGVWNEPCPIYECQTDDAVCGIRARLDGTGKITYAINGGESKITWIQDLPIECIHPWFMNPTAHGVKVYSSITTQVSFSDEELQLNHLRDAIIDALFSTHVCESKAISSSTATSTATEPAALLAT